MTEVQALSLLERQGLPKTVTELRELIPCHSSCSKITRMLTFIDICCVIFGKTLDEVNRFSAEATSEIALEEVRLCEMAAIEAENQIKHAKLCAEEVARLQREDIEIESRTVG